MTKQTTVIRIVNEMILNCIDVGDEESAKARERERGRGKEGKERDRKQRNRENKRERCNRQSANLLLREKE